MAHTPGPWKNVEYAIYAPTGEIGNFGQEVDTTIAFIADADDNGLSDAESKANACLIAAVPELLEACELIVLFCEKTGKPVDGPRFREGVAKARAAIAKAKKVS